MLLLEDCKCNNSSNDEWDEPRTGTAHASRSFDSNHCWSYESYSARRCGFSCYEAKSGEFKCFHFFNP